MLLLNGLFRMEVNFVNIYNIMPSLERSQTYNNVYGIK